MWCRLSATGAFKDSCCNDPASAAVARGGDGGSGVAASITMEDAICRELMLVEDAVHRKVTQLRSASTAQKGLHCLHLLVVDLLGVSANTEGGINIHCCYVLDVTWISEYYTQNVSSDCVCVCRSEIPLLPRFSSTK